MKPLVSLTLIAGLMGGLVGATALKLAQMHGAVPGAAPPQIVTFDVAKLTNAQRAIAAGLLDESAAGDAVVRITQIGNMTDAAIAKVAGPDTVVLVRQAVVRGELRDITGAVLKELGLPEDVPTVDPMRYLRDVAPTDIVNSLTARVVEENAKRRIREHNETVDDQRRRASEALLP